MAKTKNARKIDHENYLLFTITKAARTNHNSWNQNLIILLYFNFLQLIFDTRYPR